MRKFKKLVRTPGLFFRDYLNKRYPTINCEQKYSENEEVIILKNLKLQARLEKQIHDIQPVDVVFTWVDGEDKKWQKKKNDITVEENKLALYADDSARFENHNELYYAVYAVKKYLPWVRYIFIVTDDQSPKWLDKHDEKVKIVDHRDIIEQQYLPTYNSHVIEAHLHKISGLSENFIYLNDDMFVARYLDKSHFFRSNGIASIFVTEKSLLEMQSKGVMTPTLYASLKSVELLKQTYGVYIDWSLVHSYMPLKKSAFELAWKNYESEILAFLPNKFRSNHDLNLASFLVPWLMYCEKNAVMTQEICYYFNVRSSNALMQYKKMLSKKKQKLQPNSFCANDFTSDIQQVSEYQEKLKIMLKQYFLN